MTYVQKLHLTNFRNFSEFSLELPEYITLIFGSNGTGKTNILEALSNLAPGRGIRGAHAREICKTGADSWNIDSLVTTALGPASLNLAYDSTLNRKNLTFNGRKITLNELTNLTSAIWLTPQMDRLFVESSTERRRFLDRLALTSFPSHAALVSSYEKLQKERLHILEENGDRSWLDIMERDMAAFANDITKNRLTTIDLINKHIADIDSTFPKAEFHLESVITDFIDDLKAISEQFADHRDRDKYSGKTNFGANKTDLLAFFGSNKIPAHQCSTGQQKSLLISILMAHQIAIESRKSIRPILLLDEVFVHLDDIKRAALAEFLMVNKSQIFITSTESELKLLLKNINLISFK